MYWNVHKSLLCIFYCRNLPVGITISSQISDTPMSRIDFINNDVITMNYKIDNVSVSYPVACMHMQLYYVCSAAMHKLTL